MILQIGGSQQGSLGTIFSGIKRILNPEGARRDDLAVELFEDPKKGALFAKAGMNQLAKFETDPNLGNANVALGHPFAPLLVSKGLNPDDQKNIDFVFAQIAAHPASFEQATDQALVLEPGAVEGAVEATTTGNVAASKQNVAVGEVAENVAAQAQAFESIDGPLAAAERQKRAGEQATQLGDLEIAFNTIGVEDATERVRIWTDYNQWLTNHPEFRGLAAVASKNPAFLKHLEFSAQLSLTERLAQLKALREAGEDRIKELASVFGIFKDIQAIDRNALELIEGSARVSAGDISNEAKEGAAQRLRDLQAQLEAGGFSPGLFAVQIAELEGTNIFGRGRQSLKPTVVSPRREAPAGGGEPGQLLETRESGKEANVVDEGKIAVEELSKSEGMDAVTRLFFSNPTPQADEFRLLMMERGEFFKFLDELTKKLRTPAEKAQELGGASLR